MEEVIFDLNEGKKLFGILNGSKDDSKLVVFVHGLTGHKNEKHYVDAVSVFNQQGYSTLRFDLYSDNTQARQLVDCTVDMHSEDLNVVLESYRGKYDAIYLVGHSIGSPTIIYAKHDGIKAMALWDPSFEIYENMDLYMHREGDKYKLNWGDSHYVSPAFVESLKKVNESQLRCIDIPTVLIFGGAYRNKDRWQPHLQNIEAEHKSVIIDGADHGFSGEEHEKQLFQATLDWFNKY